MKNHQNILLPYAYNILGSVEDAKDAIQDVLTKYLTIDKTKIENEIGYLTKSVINQSINIKNRQAKITTHKVWLPEPLSTTKTDDNLNSEEILSYSLLVLFEKLSTKERAVFILKEAFDYQHKEIAETIDISIENSRKLLSRAKTKLAKNKKEGSNLQPTNPVSFMGSYMETIKNGDVKKLEKLLSEDISLYADGGENIKVVRELTEGKNACSKLLLYVYKAYLEELTVKTTEINHEPALLFFKEDVLINCQVFKIDQNKITNIYSIVDPKKLINSEYAKSQ